MKSNCWQSRQACFVKSTVVRHDMACDPKTLLSDAKCFTCLSEKQLLAIGSNPLCQILSNGPNVSGSVEITNDWASVFGSALNFTHSYTNTTGHVLTVTLPVYANVSSDRFWISLAVNGVKVSSAMADDQSSGLSSPLPMMWTLTATIPIGATVSFVGDNLALFALGGDPSETGSPQITIWP